MTFKEKLQQEYPECVGDEFYFGCEGCPSNYGYEPEQLCDLNCRECWNREIPERKEAQP